MPVGQATKIEVFGLLQNESFHIAKCCAEDLKLKYGDKFEGPAIKSMLECEWDRYVESKKIELKGELWSYMDPVICFVNGNFIGNHKELLQWAHDDYSYEDFRPETLYSAMATEAYKDYFLQSKNEFVFMDISVDGEKSGRLLFELFSEVCPKTCQNFKSLCTGECGSLPSGLHLNYSGSPVHRIVPNGWIQGGDILHGRGDGGESIFGEVFEDENFAIKHQTRGMLGMANKGRHTAGSQFYVTLQPAPWMDCQYVAFGQPISDRWVGAMSVKCLAQGHIRRSVLVPLPSTEPGTLWFRCKRLNHWATAPDLPQITLIEGTELLKTLEDLPTFNERPKVDCHVAGCGHYVPGN